MGEEREAKNEKERQKMKTEGVFPRLKAEERETRLKQDRAEDLFL